MKPILTFILVFLCCSGLCGDDYDLYKKGKNFWYKDHWQEAALAFEQLVDNHPDSSYSIKGLYFLSYCRYKLDEKKRAFDHLTDLVSKAGPAKNSNVVEDAKSLRLRIAYELSRGDSKMRAVLMEGLNDDALEVRMQAASYLSQLGDASGLAVLFDVVEHETDRDMVDRAVRYIMMVGSDEDKERLDALLQEKSASYEGKAPQMLRLVIRDVNTNQETIKINVPVSLFNLLLKSLSEQQRNVIEESGVDLNAIAKSLRSVTPGTTLFEVKSPDEEIKLYLD